MSQMRIVIETCRGKAVDCMEDPPATMPSLRFAKKSRARGDDEEEFDRAFRDLVVACHATGGHRSAASYYRTGGRREASADDGEYVEGQREFIDAMKRMRDEELRGGAPEPTP
jgi:hypothetical protein